MGDYWYFAYGSNVLREQKENRTGPIREARKAQLVGYRIAFNKRGSDGTGKANIVPDANGTVWGVVYRCSAATLGKMDTYEGVSGGHYAQRMIRVRVDGGDETDAVTYTAGSSFIDNSLVPSKKYLETILQGARTHGLPEAYIDAIAKAAQQSGGEPYHPT